MYGDHGGTFLRWCQGVIKKSSMDLERRTREKKIKWQRLTLTRLKQTHKTQDEQHKPHKKSKWTHVIREGK